MTKQKFEPDTPADPESTGEVTANEDTASLIEKLTAERDEALESRKRALADFVNFQRRASENELRARDSGIMLVARHLLPVVDQMDLSLAQKAEAMSVDQLLQATAMLREELNKGLVKSGIERIEPKAGDEFDPHFHEAVMRQPMDGVAPNHIATCFQAGFRYGEMTLRPAKVSVTPE